MVVGAGVVGRRRAAKLADAGARVRWVAPDVPVDAEADAVRERFAPAHLDDACLVFACATPEVNADVVTAAHARGLLAGRADAPTGGDFDVPAVIRRGALLVSLGTGGAAPAATRVLRAALDARLPAAWGQLVDEVAAARPDLDAEESNALARQLLDTLTGSAWHLDTGGVTD